MNFATHKVRIAAVLVLLSCTSAFAGTGGPSKEMVELETKVQILLDAVGKLQQSNDERMGVLKDLVQQNSDSVNRMSVTIDALQKQISAQQTAQGSKVDTLSGQLQSLNDSLDELKARMNRLDKAVNEISTQQQTIIPIIQNLPQPGSQSGADPSAPTSGSQTSVQPAGPSPVVPTEMAGPSAIPPTIGSRRTASASAPAAGGVAVEDLYKAAYNDWMAARYNVAAAEFSDITKTYPDAQLSGNAFYYLAEIEYRNAKYSSAVKDYNRVIDQYPDNNKVPAAHLHKAQALVQMQLKEAGIKEYRALIQRFPTSPEAAQARLKLTALNAR